MAGSPGPATPSLSEHAFEDIDPEAVADLLNAAARWGQLGVLRVARAIFHHDAWAALDHATVPTIRPGQIGDWLAGEATA